MEFWIIGVHVLAVLRILKVEAATKGYDFPLANLILEGIIAHACHDVPALLVVHRLAGAQPLLVKNTLNAERFSMREEYPLSSINSLRNNRKGMSHF